MNLGSCLFLFSMFAFSQVWSREQQQQQLNSSNDIEEQWKRRKIQQQQQDVIVTVNILFDSFPPETSWSITTTQSLSFGEEEEEAMVIASEPFGQYEFGDTSTSINVTLTKGESYDFLIEDSFGDGLCCIDPGSYTVTMQTQNEDDDDDTTTTIVLVSGGDNFGYSELTTFVIEGVVDDDGSSSNNTNTSSPPDDAPVSPLTDPPSSTPTTSLTETITTTITNEPSATVTTTMTPTDMPMVSSGELLDIVDTINAFGDFPTLVFALLLSQLSTELKLEGPFTLFAPNEDAFEALPDGAISFLVLPENIDLLSQVLLYHVIPASFVSTNFADGDTIPTLLPGEFLEIGFTDDDETITVNGNATVVMPDIMASNGVIHIIDSVLLPENFELPTSTDEPAEPAPTDSPVADNGPSVAATVTVFIDFDAFPPETGWSIKLASTNEEIFAREQLFYNILSESTTEIVQIMMGEEYVFTITDKFGDGLCCPNDGRYEVKDEAGVILVSGSGNFGSSESTRFVP